MKKKPQYLSYAIHINKTIFSVINIEAKYNHINYTKIKSIQMSTKQ